MRNIAKWVARVTPIFATAAVAVPASAQTTLPKTYGACYVPSSGTVYRIDKPVGTAPSAPSSCGVNRKGVPDIEFSWNDGVSAHSELSGLANDDHRQYLLAGARYSADGFAVSGTAGSGKLAASGPGARLVWYPGKSAFRAGIVGGTEWDDYNIGVGSVALGATVSAINYGSIAIGTGGLASGSGAMALGQSVTASADNAVALGLELVANGPRSTALGNYASTNGQTGAFVIGDYSTSAKVNATARDQFTARFEGGFRFRTSANLSTGCDLPASSGVWQCTSSRALKTGFASLDGESILDKLRTMPVEEWSYRRETGVRHIGPFAEDFRAAFGLGTDSTSIGLLDAAGVSLAGVKALEARTRALTAENAALLARLARIERAIARR